MTTLTEQIAAAFTAACLDELEAPKPGNVHVFASGHRMTAAEFVRSAEVAAAPLALPGARVGNRIRDAVEATLALVGTNTNLGIILLCAPLAAAADVRSGDLRSALAQVLASLNVRDAELAFRAIARAAPAGLGRVERHDVAEAATVTLKAAMAEASSRDRIARQYVSDFEDVFERGEPTLQAALAALGRATNGRRLQSISSFSPHFPTAISFASTAPRRRRTCAAPRRDIMSEYDPPKARPLSSPIS